MLHPPQCSESPNQSAFTEALPLLLFREWDDPGNRQTTIQYDNSPGTGGLPDPVTRFHVQITNGYFQHVLNVTHND